MRVLLVPLTFLFLGCVDLGFRDHASTHYYLGRNYEALRERSKAIEHYRTALELSQGKAEWAPNARERLRGLGGM